MGNKKAQSATALLCSALLCSALLCSALLCCQCSVPVSSLSTTFYKLFLRTEEKKNHSSTTVKLWSRRRKSADRVQLADPVGPSSFASPTRAGFAHVLISARGYHIERTLSSKNIGFIKKKTEHRPPCGTCVPGFVCVFRSAAAHISFEVK